MANNKELEERIETLETRMREKDKVPYISVKRAYFYNEYDNGNSSTAVSIKWYNGNKQKSTLTGNCTFTFIAPSGPCNLVLKLIQDGTGNRTVTWPGTVKWPSSTSPTLTTTANAVDIITFYWNGISYYGNSSLNFG